MKIFIAMKTLGWSGVSNTSKILCYLANYGIQNKSFYMQIKKYHGILKYHGFVLKFLKHFVSL
jgi:hypothetical protein